MITNLIYALIGAFVGWLTPMPKWAQDAWAKVTAWFKSKLHFS